MDIDDLRSRVTAELPRIRADLEDLVRIESVSADPARTGEVQRSAEAVAELFRGEGFEEIADWFETLAKAERSHANRFQKALDTLGN